jgi:hypothetical protein
MGIGIGVFFIAVGAILAFGVNAAVPHANLDAIGIILMVVGAIGVLIGITLTSSWRRPGPDRVIERERVYPPST